MTLNWKNISLSFTEELQKEWKNEGFDYNQTYDWINVGLKITEAKLAAWLRDEEKKSPEEILNTANLEVLYKNLSNIRKSKKKTHLFRIDCLKNPKNQKNQPNLLLNHPKHPNLI